jgi:phosphatidylglycerol:prolipoprotein diacylglycerol transferase
MTALAFFLSFTHVYGLIVGVAVAVTWHILERVLDTKRSSNLNKLWFTAMLGAVIGARLWHIGTDWSLYGMYTGTEFIWQLLAVWQGGLSILGAIVGGVVGLLVASWWWQVPIHEVRHVLDSAALALPFGQAIGRLGNYVNQELYGLPTDLPWGIFIDPGHRVAEYEQFTYFHPLFAYEAVAMLFFGCGLYAIWKKHTGLWTRGSVWWAWGSGWWFWLYLLYYSVVRFGLDFLRVDAAMAGSVLGVGMSINQVVVLGGIVGLVGYGAYRK